MKLHLSNKSKMLGGVCGGIAETINVDPSFVRIAFVIGGIFLHMAMVIIYIAMWALLPRE